MPRNELRVPQPWLGPLPTGRCGPDTSPRTASGFLTPSNPSVGFGLKCLLVFPAQGGPRKVLPLMFWCCGGLHDMGPRGPDSPAPFSDPHSQLCKRESGHLGSRLHLFPVISSLPLLPLCFSWLHFHLSEKVLQATLEPHPPVSLDEAIRTDVSLC